MCQIDKTTDNIIPLQEAMCIKLRLYYIENHAQLSHHIKIKVQITRLCQDKNEFTSISYPTKLKL